MKTMGRLPPGRALWEGGDAVGAYGTTLALELLPYFTKGRIGSMEGLYFESSATTSFHFITVSELSAQPSNPVSGLVYGTSTNPTDFALGVKHLQMLGVRYLMLFTPQTKSMANQQTGPEARRDRSRHRRSAPEGLEDLRGEERAPARHGLVGRAGCREDARRQLRAVLGPRSGTRRARCRISARGSARPRRGSRSADQLDKVWVGSGPE